MIEIKFENNMVVAYDEDKKIGECIFLDLGEQWNITHTQVDSSYQGQGIAKKLVDCVVENANIYNIKVVADCSYAKKVLESK